MALPARGLVPRRPLTILSPAPIPAPAALPCLVTPKKGELAEEFPETILSYVPDESGLFYLSSTPPSALSCPLFFVHTGMGSFLVLLLERRERMLVLGDAPAVSCVLEKKQRSL